jgi:hypothetical protein
MLRILVTCSTKEEDLEWLSSEPVHTALESVTEEKIHYTDYKSYNLRWFHQ